jgi:anti-sigma regulatory factor (Ser/Thr protein kinase)
LKNVRFRTKSDTEEALHRPRESVPTRVVIAGLLGRRIYLGEFWQSVIAFFTGSGFEPHGECYLWTPGLIRLHVVSDSLVALAYYSIPILLIAFVRKRRDLPFSWIFLLFGLFIVACGTTHVLAIYEIWHGAYWLTGVVKAVTALASVGTALLCIPLLPKALKLRSPVELDRMNRELSRSLREKDQLLKLYRREKHVATQLQEALLPQSLPNAPGLTFDACYRPGESDAEIGGDWYDAFVRTDGSIFLSVGDVAGRGLAAAATMGQLRQTLRTAGQHLNDPGSILATAEEVLSLDAPGAMATAVVALYDPEAGTLRWANAGHPPPLVRAPDGCVAALEGRGLPLGLHDRRTESTCSMELRKGSAVLLYTDGLIESTRDVVDGMRSLETAFGELDRAIAEPARALVRRVLPQGSPDDVAVLLVHVVGIDAAGFEITLPAVPSNAQVARRALRLALADCETSPEKAFGIELVVGEAIMNTIEHAYAANPGTFRMRVSKSDGEFAIEVLDAGKWRERVLLDGRGRGFEIMRHFSDGVEIVHRDDGTTVNLKIKLE